MFRKLRILCLHGYGQSGSHLKQKIETSVFTTASDFLRDSIEFVFLDAPHAAEGEFGLVLQRDPKIPNPPAPARRKADSFKWAEPAALLRTPEPKRFAGIYEGLPDTLRYIGRKFAELGNFDGLLGFSQGGIICHYIVNFVVGRYGGDFELAAAALERGFNLQTKNYLAEHFGLRENMLAGGRGSGKALGGPPAVGEETETSRRGSSEAPALPHIEGVTYDALPGNPSLSVQKSYINSSLVSSAGHNYRANIVQKKVQAEHEETEPPATTRSMRTTSSNTNAAVLSLQFLVVISSPVPRDGSFPTEGRLQAMKPRFPEMSCLSILQEDDTVVDPSLSLTGLVGNYDPVVVVKNKVGGHRVPKAENVSAEDIEKIVNFFQHELDRALILRGTAGAEEASSTTQSTCTEEGGPAPAARMPAPRFLAKL
ncbi:unnamed protein product [Amoebophrya sp. A120]|nr:unnamed protein product [Amoebophrya sp. A120]|eukprot:GSA120T00002680001.1